MKLSEDDIVRQQIEGDLQLYGSRPEPPDTVEVDESTQLTNLPPKRNASEFKAVVDRLAITSEKDHSKEFNYEALTVMDWNSGTSPLDAWLNQSAIPSTNPVLNHQETVDSESDLLALETEELKVFRNVHMVASAPSPEHNDPSLEAVEGLDFGAQIYYRNIMDRFPVLPKYLTRRLAQANCDRVERLRHEKERMQKVWHVRELLSERRNKVRRTENIRKLNRQLQILQEMINKCKMKGVEFKMKRVVKLDSNHICERGFTSRAESPACLEFWQKRNLPSRYLKIEDMEQEVRALEADMQYYQLQNDFIDFTPNATDVVDGLISRNSTSETLDFFSTRPPLVQGGASCLPTLSPSKDLCVIQPSPAWTSSIDGSMLAPPLDQLRPSTPKSPSQEDANGHSWKRLLSQQFSQYRDGLLTMPLDHARPPFTLPPKVPIPATTPPPLVEECTPPPPVDFWTRGEQSSRPASVHSRSSSMNSSLHGSPAFDPEEQDPTFASKLPGSTGGRRQNSPALPPAPVELGKVTAFNCDICGQTLEIKRRLEWQ